MIFSAFLALSLLTAHANITHERDDEHGEVNQEACLSGGCYKDVNTTVLTNNDWAERDLAERIMETKMPPKPISNTEGAAVREN